MKAFVSFLLFKSASIFFFSVLYKNISTSTGNVEEIPGASHFSRSLSLPVRGEILPLVPPAAEIQTVAGFHPPVVQCWDHHLLRQNSVQSDQKPFDKFPDFHDFAETQFYPSLS